MLEPNNSELSSELDSLEQELANQQAELQRQKEELLRKQQELQERAEKLKQEKAELEKQKLLAKPVKLTIDSFQEYSRTVTIRNDQYRPDVVEMFKSITSRQYQGGSFNSIKLSDLEDFITKVKTLRDVELVYPSKLKMEIDKFLTEPDAIVAKFDKFVEIKPAQRNRDLITFYDIPGGIQNLATKSWRVPLQEAWRILGTLDKFQTVVYSREAREFLSKIIEDRKRLDEIVLGGTDVPKYKMGDITLRDFQNVGVAFLNATNGRALVADQMGLGKTAQAVTYFHTNKYRTLIVCPASLKPKWEREIINMTGIEPIVLSGSIPSTQDMKAVLTERAKYPYVIINYDVLGRKTKEEEKVTKDEKGIAHVVPAHDRYLWAEFLDLAKFDCIVYDESHKLKNPDAQRTKAAIKITAPHIIALTGTPVLNRPGEFWSTLHILYPEKFPSYEKFLNTYTFDGKTARNVGELRELLKTIMIRRVKKDILTELPPINRIPAYHELSPEAKERYNKALKGVYETIDSYGENVSKNIPNIIVMINRLKQICAYDKVDHAADLATELYDSGNGEGNNKVVIFTQYHETVDQITRRLGQEAVWFDGRVTDKNERDRRVQQFQDDPNIHFLVTTMQTGGVGHNMTAAGHVIFVDFGWTPADHSQAEERVYGRLVDAHGADAYYITCEKTIEDWIQQLLAQKLAVINEVVEGVEASRDVSIASALISKLQNTFRTYLK